MVSPRLSLCYQVLRSFRELLRWQDSVGAQRSISVLYSNWFLEPTEVIIGSSRPRVTNPFSLKHATYWMPTWLAPAMKPFSAHASAQQKEPAYSTDNLRRSVNPQASRECHGSRSLASMLITPKTIVILSLVCLRCWDGANGESL